MQKKLSLKVLPSEAADPAAMQTILARASGTDAERITGYQIIKQSIDARGRQVWLQLTLLLFIEEPVSPLALVPLQLRNVANAPRTVVD